MKFLHLSDLHIGKIVNGFSMLDELRYVFEQIIGYIKTEHPNAVIIAGDIYDRAVPGVDAVRVLDDFLTELSDTETAVMLISGNHDSPERLNYASRLLSYKRIFLCGAFDGTLSKSTLYDEYGEVNFWLLPFVKPSSVRGLFGERQIESYNDALIAAIETANIDYSARNVLVSHQFFTKAGVTPVRSESELNPVGGLDAVDCTPLENFDYVALGHLHGSQKVGAEHIRYAGSPVKYSFSEWRQEKSVLLVELNEKGNRNITALPLKPIHDMREIRGEIEKLISGEISSDITGMPHTDREDYIRVILTDKEEIVDPIGKIRSVYPNVMSLDFDRSFPGADISGFEQYPNPDYNNYEKTVQMSSYDLFSEFFLDMSGEVMSEEQMKIIIELFETGGEN